MKMDLPSNHHLGPRQVADQQAATSLLVLSLLTVALLPGAVLGAMAALCVWILTRADRASRWVVALLSAGCAVLLHATILWGWPWRLLWGEALHALFPALTPLVADRSLVGSVEVEALAGPLLLEVLVLAQRLGQASATVQLGQDQRRDDARTRAARQEPQAPSPARMAHPPGMIRFGTNAETGRPFDLVPKDLAQHVYLEGATGMGKTISVIRLCDGALANGSGLVVVDCKGGMLGPALQRLAGRYVVPFRVVDPDDPESLGYNPCLGDPAAVANKLIGAFTFAPVAEVYQHVALEVLPVLVRALQAVDRPVTVASLARLCGKGEMERLGRALTEKHPEEEGQELRERLTELAGRGNLVGGGLSGLQSHLGALLEGTFGNLFRAADRGQPVLSWEEALAVPSVTYLALRKTNSSLDVELLGRVVAQDLKQVVARRLRAMLQGATPVPLLVIFDEFAALQEAEQLVDLLLQAREAGISLVVATQSLPESAPLRKAVLGAGLVIVHRVIAEEAEELAAHFGTRHTLEATHQLDFATGYAEKGSIRRVEKYNVHPDTLRQLRIGEAAVRSVPSQRHALVHVYREEKER